MFGPDVLGWDLLRCVAMVLAALVVITAALISVNERFDRNQMLRSIGAAVIGIAVIGRYLAQLGTPAGPAGWALVAITIGVFLLAVGNWQLLARNRTTY